jgi:hypothetical protein
MLSFVMGRTGDGDQIQIRVFGAVEVLRGSRRLAIGVGF